MIYQSLRGPTNKSWAGWKEQRERKRIIRPLTRNSTKEPKLMQAAAAAVVVFRESSKYFLVWNKFGCAPGDKLILHTRRARWMKVCVCVDALLSLRHARNPLILASLLQKTAHEKRHEMDANASPWSDNADWEEFSIESSSAAQLWRTRLSLLLIKACECTAEKFITKLGKLPGGFWSFLMLCWISFTTLSQPLTTAVYILSNRQEEFLFDASFEKKTQIHLMILRQTSVLWVICLTRLQKKTPPRF